MSGSDKRKDNFNINSNQDTTMRTTIRENTFCHRMAVSFQETGTTTISLNEEGKFALATLRLKIKEFTE
jgi:hypothetical protein